MAPRSRSILTPTQWAVLERLARGESNAAIARELGIAPGTVKAHLANINKCLPHTGTPQRAAAVAWYLREGRRLRE